MGQEPSPRNAHRLGLEFQAVDGWVPIVFLMFVLKIPVAMLLYIVWWAFHADTDPEEAPDQGAEDPHFRRFRRQPRLPRGPRRGGPAPDCLPLPGGADHGSRATRPAYGSPTSRASASAGASPAPRSAASSNSSS